MRITPALALVVLPVLVSGLLAPLGTPRAHASPAAPTAAAGPRGVQARSALVADIGTGEILWARRPHTRRPIGSITKVMTAVVVLREGSLNRRLRVKGHHLAYAHARNGSTARLRPGDRLRVRDLLTAMLLPSGCDAAAVLADSYGPGRTRFLRKMNRLARHLGMTRTHYSDVAGLPPAPGLSTARDQVVLGKYALGFPTFRAIVGRSRHTLRAGDGHGRYVWRNTNVMLGDYPGMIGIKSGHTNAAGYSFLFGARRDGRTLVGAVLNSSLTQRRARFRDAARVLDWGFRH